MQNSISIIVPAYNEQELIASCLDSLVRQNLDKNTYEIIVVDNNSTDLTAKIALEKGVRVVKELRKGYVHAIRKGIEVSQADLIAFTDADCRVPADWVERILADFAVSPQVVGVGGKLAFYDLNPIVNWFYRTILYFNQALPGNNFAARREALSCIGGVDPMVNLGVDFWITMKLRKIGKLRIDRRLVVQTSGRRFRVSFSSNIRYFINVLTLLIASKPLFYDFPDIREG